MNTCVCSVSGCTIYISIIFVFPVLILITVTQVLSYLPRRQINVCDVVRYLLYLFIIINIDTARLVYFSYFDRIIGDRGSWLITIRGTTMFQ